MKSVRAIYLLGFITLLVPLALTMLATEVRAKPIGAYFSTVNTYVFLDGPGAGKRAFVRARQSYRVFDLRVDDKDNMWFLIQLKERQEKITGEGWTFRQPHELVATEQGLARIFTRIPEGRLRGLEMHRVPISGLKLVNESRASTEFPGVDWQKVKFNFSQDQTAWVRAVTGIYRVGIPQSYLARVYGEMVTRNVEKSKLERLLSGVVRIGDTLREVSWALGDPLRRQEETVANSQRITWEYPELRVQFENQVVLQVN